MFCIIFNILFSLFHQITASNMFIKLKTRECHEFEGLNLMNSVVHHRKFNVLDEKSNIHVFIRSDISGYLATDLCLSLPGLPNPIKLDVFRCVPCYIPSNDPEYLL